MTVGAQTPEHQMLERLEQRLGRVHARLRLGIEEDHEAVFGHGLNFFHPENWYSAHALLRGALKASGIYGRGNRNGRRIQIRHNEVEVENLPSAFEGFRLLHVTDLHSDLHPGAIESLIALLPGLSYDVCVLTGDFRGQTFGPYAAALDGLRRVREQLHGPVYGVLGNHDTVRMLPAIEAMQIRMLMNESEPLVRDHQRIHLCGVDDAHYYRADNIHQATRSVPADEVAILLSHTPEIYRQAAHAGFSLMLSGHTHGGQICLPGSIPLTLDAALPRSMGAGSWTYHKMAGYTSVGVGCSIVPVRFNCPPEITIHQLRRRRSSP
ncbi:MAG TPA: metallophosphoesterase [Edaphobacter sp.]|nr:metallophosphoesterase [Edaphobacter sp.]